MRRCSLSHAYEWMYINRKVEEEIDWVGVTSNFLIIHNKSMVYHASHGTTAFLESSSTELLLRLFSLPTITEALTPESGSSAFFHEH